MYDATGRDVNEVFVNDGGIIRLTVQSEQERLVELVKASSPEPISEPVAWTDPFLHSQRLEPLTRWVPSQWAPDLFKADQVKGCTDLPGITPSQTTTL